MPNWRTLVPSRYFKKEDFEEATTLTLKEIRLEDVSLEEEPEKLRPVAYFEEEKSGLVLNNVNMESMEEITGETDYERWAGIRFELYVDPRVTFAGKKVGGIRVRKPSAPSDPLGGALG